MRPSGCSCVKLVCALVAVLLHIILLVSVCESAPAAPAADLHDAADLQDEDQLANLHNLDRDVRETSDDLMRDFIEAYIMNKMGGGGLGMSEPQDKRGYRSKNCKINLVACYGRRRRR